MNGDHPRHADGTFAPASLEAVYSEIKRLDQLRDSAFDALDKRLEGRFASLAHALVLSETRLDGRLEGMNELRSQLDRQASTFSTKDSVDEQLRSVSARFRLLEKFQDNLTGKLAIVGAIASVLGAILGAVLVTVLTGGRVIAP